MSYSLSKSGSKEDVQKYLDEEAPKAIAHVTGVERTLADQMLGLARAIVEANQQPDKLDNYVSVSGSASFDGADQVSQTITMNVGVATKLQQ